MLEGEERELSIMFTDVRGFTSISEKLPPQEIVSLLSTLSTPFFYKVFLLYNLYSYDIFCIKHYIMRLLCKQKKQLKLRN